MVLKVWFNDRMSCYFYSKQVLGLLLLNIKGAMCRNDRGQYITRVTPFQYSVCCCSLWLKLTPAVSMLGQLAVLVVLLDDEFHLRGTYERHGKVIPSG